MMRGSQMTSLHCEVANWHKALASDKDFENCVEVGNSGDTVGIRDTKHRDLSVNVRPVLAISRGTFTVFAMSVVAG